MSTFEERVMCGNPLQQFGSGLEPDPEPTREFGPVANTMDDITTTFQKGVSSEHQQFLVLHLGLSTGHPTFVNP